MKAKFLAVLGLAAVAGFAGCKGAANTNVANTTNTNMMVMNTTTPAPITKTTETTMTDPNLKTNIEKELKAKGFSAVTVDTSGPKMVARGSVAKGKMGEMMQVIMAANGGKPVDNQVTEK